MNVLFDEGVPGPLRFRLQEHSVETVRSMDWRGIGNGSLMRLIAQAGFEVFLTADKNMEYQQAVASLPFGLIVLSLNNWRIIREGNVDVIRQAILQSKPGTVLHVDCGHFVPKRFRRS